MTTIDLLQRLNNTGLSVTEIAFIKTPTYPAVVYFIDPSGEGSDDENLINNYDIRLELYSQSVDKATEKLIEEDVLYDVEYDSVSGYINEQNLYYRFYTFSLSEKI